MQNDIAKRFGIKNQTRLEEILKFMFDNIGKESSLRNITGWLRQDGIDVSPATLNDYIKGALDSYLLHKCERWDVRGRAILQTNPKYYAADMGLRTALLGHPDSDYGRVLENIVYLELLRRGYEVYVGKIGNGEVDFIAQQPGGILEYYQVSWHILGNEKTIKREYSALEDIKDNYPKYLLTMDNGAGGQGGIKRQNVLKWLLGE
jgi:predicted AAA+ superfamily ATPase